MQDMPTTGEGTDASGLPDRPYLKPWYRLARVDGRLILEYAQSTVVLEGKAAEKLLPVLLPLLDGTRTVEEITAYVGDAAAPAVTNAISLLAERGVLTDGPPLAEDAPAPVAEMAQFLTAISRDGRKLTESEEILAGASVSVVGAGPAASEIAKSLRVAGVAGLSFGDWTQPGDGGSPDLVVVAPEPDELPELEGWNRRALDAGVPWLQVLPFDGRIAAIGPLYVPGETCCYECYRRRRAANVNFPLDDYWALEQSPASYPAPPPIRQMAAGLAAMLALQWLSDRAGSGGQSPVPGTMHALAWSQTVELSSHSVYRVPRCPVCFPDDQGTPSPWHG